MNTPTTTQWLRQAAHRIHTGSGRLAAHLASLTAHAARRVWHRVTAWLGQGTGLGWLLRLAVLLATAALLRKTALAVAGGLYTAAADGRAPWMMWGAAGAWLITAYRCGHPDWTPGRTPAPDPEPAPATIGEPTEAAGEAEGEPPATAEEPPGPPPVSPTALVAAVRDIGTPHAQLKPLAEHLAATTDAVRAAAAGMGWAVKDVRMQGRSASAGLRWDEAPSPAPSALSSGVVGAGQSADDNDDDTEKEGPREGIAVRRTDGGLIIYDLADTHRRRGAVTH
ncbi:hypothetical protein [Streptomyces sp. SID8352]|uniref:hypothetical protein n=1 Tax=Streptomyces sp. SID8352 TaxID=2690338 RepID=UPI00136B34B0|nr:hypothetical protein [Streptomyces sp. SID8352]MYU22921.1 hypothetical protein [Streptomyces sp. SID8352]